MNKMSREVLQALMQPAIEAMVTEVLPLIKAAIRRKTGVYTYSEIFDEVRPLMPASDLAWLDSKSIDNIVRGSIEQYIDSNSLSRCFSSPKEEVAFLEKLGDCMDKHGFETAGPALELLRKQQLN